MLTRCLLFCRSPLFCYIVLYRRKIGILAGNDKFQIVKQKQIRSGLYVYKTNRSPYWQAKVWIPSQRRYFTKSTKETNQLDAWDVAIAFADKTFSTVGHIQRNPKATRFETYADRFDREMRAAEGQTSRKYRDYHGMLYRRKDGIVHFFGDMQVAEIKSGTMRDYLGALDQARSKSLAGGTKKKHVMAIRAVLRMAFEDEVIERVPDSPKIQTKDRPRTAFNDSQYKAFMRASHTCVARGDVVSGIKLTHHHVHIFRFIVNSFVRPTAGELFYLKHRDIQIRSHPPRLEMIIRKGKTGLRESFTMPFAVVIYKSVAGYEEQRQKKMDQYVFMPEYDNREYARTAMSRIFSHILKEAGLHQADDKFTTYSLRHYALQKRVRDSRSKVNINLLAKNAGTSVEMLERFYLSRMTPSPEIIAEFQSND